MTYEEWEKADPLEIKGDTVWCIEVYRLSLFAADSTVINLLQDIPLP
jgi:hypothetical protein